MWTHAEEEDIVRGLAWILIGVGVGLLLAPRTGEQTRQELMNRLQDVGNKARSGELTDAVSEGIGKVAEQAQQAGA